MTRPLTVVPLTRLDRPRSFAAEPTEQYTPADQDAVRAWWNDALDEEWDGLLDAIVENRNDNLPE